MTGDLPVSWRTIVYGTPVVSSDGERVGEVREVLGSDAEDIFHGLRVKLGRQGRDVMLAADDVTNLSADAIGTRLPRRDIEALEDYNETATYHLASVGWLRKHLGWRQDSKSDEEPG
jgi:PRC-barrel domain protein